MRLTSSQARPPTPGGMHEACAHGARGRLLGGGGKAPPGGCPPRLQPCYFARRPQRTADTLFAGQRAPGRAAKTRFGPAEAGTRLGFGAVVALFKSILVAYDDPSSGTLARAADLAELTGSTLIVTNVVPPVEPSEMKEAESSARQRLDEAGSYLQRRGLSGELVPSVGPPAETILRLAEERHVDLLVVGTRRKGFFERLVEGSVAQDVLRGASCDVIVVY